jgi:hypothetical protein
MVTSQKFQHRELPARVGGHRSVRAGRGGGLEVKHDQNWGGQLSGFERLHRWANLALA